MEIYLLSIKVPEYLKEWAMTAYQVPNCNYISFPILSNENSVIRRFLQKAPSAKLSELEIEEKELFEESEQKDKANQHKKKNEEDEDDLKSDREKNPENYVDILIPESKAKPARDFNYIGPRGRSAIKEIIVDLFKHNLWADLLDMPDLKKELHIKESSLISAWCELHGIDIDHEDTVRQIFYRIRAQHARNGVNLSSFNRIKDKLT